MHGSEATRQQSRPRDSLTQPARCDKISAQCGLEGAQPLGTKHVLYCRQCNRKVTWITEAVIRCPMCMQAADFKQAIDNAFAFLRHSSAPGSGDASDEEPMPEFVLRKKLRFSN